ncbi:hypothetical protein RFI_23820 [Reticulomyxa filosa]|uniref:Anoctamin transmembrane domain-containing protein n=1 Tax=Reticulomyxa filosa TaxID=46433 RepID=X6MI53_RETFI|nr:hypothetical protein RFI_23820 [Reticulomyxa filosa]|eukprot:ETO13549.1 hypothetical protein RFI_23820 [Reticulomyxa filosa]
MESHKEHHHEENSFEGFCFVFARETAKYKVHVDGNCLKVEEKKDFVQNQAHKYFQELILPKKKNFFVFHIVSILYLSFFSKIEKRAKKKKKKNGPINRALTCELSDAERENLLSGLTKKLNAAKEQVFHYCIATSKNEPDLICVLIWADFKEVERYAAERELVLEINPTEAIKEGRKLGHFKLAHNTLLASEQSHVCESCRSYNHDNKAKENYLPMSDWEHIHIPFESSLHRRIYQKNEHNSSVLSNRLYLRVLYDMITDDIKTGGAGYNVNKQATNPHHPLQYTFAVHDEDWMTHLPPGKKLFALGLRKQFSQIDQIRDYYGELIAFYFAFLLHYQRYLLYIAPIGALWFIIQVSLSEIVIRGSFGFVVYSNEFVYLIFFLF